MEGGKWKWYLDSRLEREREGKWRRVDVARRVLLLMGYLGTVCVLRCRRSCRGFVLVIRVGGKESAARIERALWVACWVSRGNGNGR